MPITLTPESKNTEISLSNISKVSADDTWEEATYTWEEAGLSTWENQRVFVAKEAKNSAITLSNEAKN